MPQKLLTKQQVNRYFEENPKSTMTAAAAHFGVSKATVNNRMTQGAGGRVLRLTDTDVKVFGFIVDYIVEHGWSPSVSDITDGVGCSRSTAHSSMHRLAAYGSIVIGEGQPRMIRVVGSTVSMKGVKRDPR